MFGLSCYEFNCYEHGEVSQLYWKYPFKWKRKEPSTNQTALSPQKEFKYPPSFITESSTSEQWMWNKWTISKYTLGFAQHDVQTQAGWVPGPGKAL